MYSTDFVELVESLIRHEVEYLIIEKGDHSVPGNLEIWLNASVKNAKKIMHFVDDFVEDHGLTIEDFEKDGYGFQLGDPPINISIMNKVIAGITFDLAYQNIKLVQIEHLSVNFIGVNEKWRFNPN